METPVFELGITSIDLIKLSRRIEEQLASKVKMSVTIILTNPTVRALTKTLENLNDPKQYKPVMTLQPNRRKSTLWLFHPGVGEILVFINLAN